MSCWITKEQDSEGQPEECLSSKSVDDDDSDLRIDFVGVEQRYHAEQAQDESGKNHKEENADVNCRVNGEVERLVYSGEVQSHGSTVSFVEFNGTILLMLTLEAIV